LRGEQDLTLSVKYKVPMVITSLDARANVIQGACGYGGIVLRDFINERFARKAIDRARWPRSIQAAAVRFIGHEFHRTPRRQ